MNSELDLYSAMQSGNPYKTYKKAVLGRVYVSVLDPFSDQPIGVMLYGDPKRNDETCYIDMWSERDDLFFRRTNKGHLASGFILEAKRSTATEAVELPFEQYNDDQLREVINKKFLGLQAVLNKMTSDVVLFRMIDLAKDMEKSDKIIGAIEARLEEVSRKDEENIG